jgi:polyketide cyclase/dehydrase/lipid transport protein
MTLRVCPIAHVRAPARKVWSMLSQPVNYALWWDARTVSIEPNGPAQPGQQIRARSRAFGVLWNVYVLVEQVDERHHTLDVMTTLPLGIILFNHITVKELDPGSSQLSFGSEFSFSPVWWGWVLQRFASQPLYREVASTVTRMKQAAESAL